MEVSEAQMGLTGGRENLVKARLALHAMDPGEMRKPIDAGMAMRRRRSTPAKRRCGRRIFRRWGLAVSVLLIGIAILAIRFLIRRNRIQRKPRNGRPHNKDLYENNRSLQLSYGSSPPACSMQALRRGKELFTAQVSSLSRGQRRGQSRHRQDVQCHDAGY